MKVHCECGYCGNEWDVFFTAKEPVCSKCGETQLVRTRKDKGTGNVFGYEDATKPEVKYGYNED